MTIFAGAVWGNEQDSYVYAIFARSGVYFGETGDLPPKRWSGHLSEGGTLQNKLRQFSEEINSNVTPYLFVAINCDAISTVAPKLRKLARRAVEEELHRRFLLDQSALAPTDFLLSTAPPAPIRMRFQFDPRAVAIEAYALIALKYQEWRAQQIT